ncbi:MAG TPA: universal stress protein [Longimicrobium sp.]|nr:universal stress protein [Longimicrobium sp.]
MNDRIDTLVAGVGSLGDMDPLIPRAAALANRAGLPLQLVHAFDLSDPFVDSYLRSSTLPGDPLLHYQEGLQARMEGQVGGLAGHGEVHCRAVPGTPPAVLGDAACDAGCLLVVGPTHRGPAGAALLGTTAQRVLHGARIPVLVLRGDLPPAPRVLVCVDVASPHAAAMLHRGLAAVESLSPGAAAIDVRVLLVVGLEVDLPIPGLHDRLAGAAREQLDAFVAELGELPEGVRVEGRVRTGAPAREAVAEAAEWPAELVVVGSHGRGGAARALLGSVAEAVVRDAPCSVLVVPSPVPSPRP